MTLLPKEIQQLSDQFEGKHPGDVLEWAINRFGPNIALSSSFQTESMPLLHMLLKIRGDVRIFFLDTGFHFWETLIFRERLQLEWKLNVVDLYRDSIWENFCRRFGRNLPLQDPNLCCYIHKVHPMQKALQGLQAWITGIRRDQTPERARAHFLEVQPDGLLKINPLLNWSKQDIQVYIQQYNLPSHPLLEKGYRSVGCLPCTRPVAPDEPDRAGRWAGLGKTECGLHTDMFQQKDLASARRYFTLDPLHTLGSEEPD